MSNSISSMLNSRLRMSGLASGLDTDTMIKQLMQVETMKVDRVKQQKQLLEWKRDSYRDVTNSLRGFRDTFMDVLSTTNMRSQKSYKAFSVTSSDSKYVTAIGLPDAAAGNHTIQVKSVATSEVIQSSAGVTKDIVGNAITDLNLDNVEGKNLAITIDGTTKVIKIGDSLTTLADLAASIQSGIADAFGGGKVQVGLTTEDKLTFTPVGIGVNRITLSNSSENDGLGAIGFTSGANYSNRLNIYDTLDALSSKLKNGAITFTEVDDNEVVKFTINNKEFVFDKHMTISSMMSQVSADSTANVNMKYDEVNDEFVFTSKQTGKGANINITESGSNFMTKIVLYDREEGEDAQAIIDGQTVTRSDNTFAVSGVSYTLWKETEVGTEINVSLSMDVDKVYDNIKTFVDKYNEVIDAINTELGEKQDRDYQPLTDEQKESMSEEEIKKWEDKAKAGILRNDGVLQKIAADMRRALYDKIEGVPNGIAKIGITTGSYQGNGKLVINEVELKKAIKNTPDLVMNIFSKESSTTYFDTLDDKNKKTTRYEQNGLASRLYDIIQDNIRTMRDKNDKKGVLLEMAGISGDITEFDSLLVDEIERKDKQVNDLIDKLYDKETAYYKRFTAMETALSQMNSQSSWLSQQFGGSQ